MRDRGLFWSPVPDWPRVDIRHQALAVTAQSAQAAWLVSGNLARFLEQRGGLPCVGPRETCDQESYALRLAPDRLLFVRRNAAPEKSMAFGWSDEGFAVTDVSDGFVLFDVSGPAAQDLMALGASYDFAGAPGGAAESASMSFANLRAAVARLPAGWRLHVERPHAAAMWHWLQRAAQEWAKPPSAP